MFTKKCTIKCKISWEENLKNHSNIKLKNICSNDKIYFNSGMKGKSCLVIFSKINILIASRGNSFIK